MSHKTSFYIILGLIFLLPLFFIPGGAISLGVAKSALLILAVALGALVYVYGLWRERMVILPKHPIVLAIVALPVVYLLSALLATPSSLSLFGYSFEAGTFGYMVLGAALLVLASSIFTDASRALQVLTAFFISFTFIAIFAVAKILLGGDALVFGNFAGNMGSPLGGWPDLGMAYGLLAVFSALAIGMIPMKAAVKTILYAVFLLALVLLVVTSFSAAFILTFVASIALFFYFLRAERHYDSGGEMGERSFFARPILLPVLLGIVSLVFFINPNISEDRTLSQAVSGAFGVENAEVRPTLSATLGVSKAVLSQVALLGSGPNTFGSDWLIYRPRDINATPFWSTAFSFGVGFIPTQIATTGVLGSAVWLVFFIMLIMLGIKSLSRLPDSRAERFVMVFSLIASVFIWIASFLYVPSSAMLMFGFIFTGLFLASLMQVGVVPAYVADLRASSQARFAGAFVIILVALGAAGLGWIGYEKTVAAYHFTSAVKLSNIEGTQLAQIEESLVKAVNTSPEDVYFVALSRLNFSRAQIVANSATGTPEQNRAVFDESIKKSIEAARLAVSANPAGYENWVQLATVYSAIVPKPLAVEGAYENALFAYNEAVKRNPSNPELPLLIARLELNKENVDNARSYLRNSIALKQDYADAYLMLAQLEVAAGNTVAAIASTEKLAVLVPENPGVHFELGLLKYSSKNYEGATESFGRALSLSPDYANAKYYMGLALANLNRFAEAQAALEDLVAGNPDNADLMAALEAVKKNKVPVPPAPAATTPSQ